MVKALTEHIVLHDVMSDGLTLDISSFSVNGPSITADDYKIYVSSALTTTGTKPDSIDQSINIAETDITDGAATNPKTLHAKDNDSFVIIFGADYVSELEENAEITVTYSAILNDNAVVGTAEKNVSHITYSNQTTQNKEVEVNTYDVDILKYAREDSNKKAIAGAVFQLQDKDGNALWLTKETDVAGCDVYEIALNQATDLTGLTEIEDENGNIIGYKDNNNNQVLYKQFTTTKDLKVRILGLDVDKSYLLEELKAPAGYNKLDQKIKAEASGTTLDFGDIEVANQAGAELPSTGGMGTTIFYVVGSILLIGAAVLLITRKRMNAKK